jgi:predicted 3-demethylubiquinone-9 3-methyltransferase (glyoxalase superfamily)
MSKLQKVVPHLWYTKHAEEAAQFYASVFPDSRVDRVTMIPADTPSGPAGSIPIVEFTVLGQQFMAIGAGPLDDFNHSISFLVHCDDQAEIDRYWERLTADGGEAEQCGWVKDKYGVLWQISPVAFHAMMISADRAGAKRATEAMLKMTKLDIAALQRAFDGT